MKITKTMVLLSELACKKYRIMPKMDYQKWPESTKKRFLKVDEGSLAYCEKKSSLLIKYLGNGATY
jgi:hypothetical protein